MLVDFVKGAKQIFARKKCEEKFSSVSMVGIEPTTSSVSVKRSKPIELHGCIFKNINVLSQNLQTPLMTLTV